MAEVLPEQLELTVRPNPLQAATSIYLALPSSGEVTISVFDVNGKLITEAFQGTRSAGFHAFQWEGCDQSGVQVSSGVYFCRVTFEGRLAAMQKMIKM